MKVLPLLTTLAVVLLSCLAFAGADEDYPKRAPYAAIRWSGDSPEVRHEGAWYELVSIDGTKASEIVAFCQETYGARWQKRFEEDLVEVLSTMEKRVSESVDLGLREKESGELRTFKGVAMTGANRGAIWEASRKRRSADRSAPPPPGSVQRIERKHKKIVNANFNYLTFAMQLERDTGETPLDGDRAREDLDQLEWSVEHHFSYRDRLGIDYREAFDAVRLSIGETIGPRAFALQISKLLALFGDGHTRLSVNPDSFLPRGYLPFLIEKTQSGYVAIREDRTDYFEKGFPYLVMIDGVNLDEWIAAAKELSPTGSGQFVLRRALRNLRYLSYMRRVLGIEHNDVAEVLFCTEGSTRTSMNLIPIAEKKPTFGPWPRSETRRLEGDIGYLRIPRMDSNRAVLASLHATMHDFKDTEGLVIDVRGNGGGSRDILRALFPYLMAEDAPPRVANVAAYRLHEGDAADDSEGFLANRFLFPAASKSWSPGAREAIETFAKDFRPEWRFPKEDFSDWHYMVLERDPEKHDFTYEKKVIVLLDTGCFSATDIFLAAFKGWPNVTLLGSTSGGGSGRSRPVRLAHSGLELRLSSMASFQPTGDLYDGNGIKPDVHVPLLPTDVLGDGDYALQQAHARLR